MRTQRSVVITGCAVLATALTMGAVAGPAAAASNKPPEVKLKGTKSAVTANKESVPAGVVQFKVNKAQPEDNLAVVSSKNIDKALGQLPTLFSQDENPTALAKAVTYLNSHATIFGGAGKGTTWQVVLPKGKYYVVSTNSAGAGTPMMDTFTVTGKTGSTKLHKTSATITAAKPNVWKTKGLNNLGSGWLEFRNTSEELHFLEMAGVKSGTTNEQVEAALSDPNAEPDFFTKKGFSFDVISPGIDVAIKGPVDKGEYLLDCFIPSEDDGMPHAFMGMWKLVEVD